MNNEPFSLPDVTPVLLPAAEIAPETWLVCGGCGFNGTVKAYVFVEKPWCFDPVCNCPLPAVLTA